MLACRAAADDDADASAVDAGEGRAGAAAVAAATAAYGCLRCNCLPWCLHSLLWFLLLVSICSIPGLS